MTRPRPWFRAHLLIGGLGLAAVALAALGGSAEAAHEVDHRYVVVGYVRNDIGRAVAGVTVRVVREKTGLIHRAETDAEGFYLAIVHLHDEDLGEALQIMTDGASLRVQARFDPGDRRSPRGPRVDFGGGRAWERREAFAGSLAEYLKR